QQRLDTVEFLIKDPHLRNALAQHIHQCGDIERLVSKIPIRRIGPREILQLARGLEHIQHIKAMAATFPEGWLPEITSQLDPCPAINQQIIATIDDNPPAVAAKGNVIRPGVNAELDRLRNIASNGKGYLVELQQKEAERSGITSLKIGFN